MNNKVLPSEVVVRCWSAPMTECLLGKPRDPDPTIEQRTYGPGGDKTFFQPIKDRMHIERRRSDQCTSFVLVFSPNRTSAGLTSATWQGRNHTSHPI